MGDFDAFTPIPVKLDIGGETLEITPIRVGEIPELIRAVRPFIKQLSVEPNWLALFAEHGESIIHAISIAARRERVWVEQLSLDDAVLLATVLFEVNADFFVQRLAPVIQQAAMRVNNLLGGVMQSTGSSVQGTASQTS